MGSQNSVKYVMFRSQAYLVNTDTKELLIDTDITYFEG